MATFTDDFNRADGALGSEWSGVVNFEIESNAVVQTVDSLAEAWTDQGLTADHYVEVDPLVSDTNQFNFLMLRAASASWSGGTFYRAAVTQFGVANGEQILKHISGTETILSDDAWREQDFTFNLRWRFEVDGSTLTVYRGATEVASITDTSITSGAIVGFGRARFYDEPDARYIDDFETGDLGASGVTGTAGLTGLVGVLSATGSRTIPPVTGTAGLTGLVGTLAGSGTHTPPSVAGAAALTGQVGVLAGSGTHTPPAFTGTSALTGLVGVLAASGAVVNPPGVVGIGDLTGYVGTLAGSGATTPPDLTGTAALTGHMGVLAASGAVVNPPGSVGTADLTGLVGSLSASGAYTPPPASGTAGLVGLVGSLSAVGAVTVPGFAGTSAMSGHVGSIAAVGVFTIDRAGTATLVGHVGVLQATGVRTGIDMVTLVPKNIVGPRYASSDTLWQLIPPAPGWPESILIANDGSLVSKSNPTTAEVAAAKYALLGGRRHEVEVGSELYDILASNGYEFRAVEQ